MNRPEFRALALIVLAAACGSSPDYDARAPRVPYIDQFNPAGATQDYDGREFCGPALLAGIAKTRGDTFGLNDADLVSYLAEVAGTDLYTGTTGYGMVGALEYLGLETAANRGADLEWIDDELAAGHDVIADGDYYAVPGREEPGKHAGHFIAVTAVRDDWTVYEVTDPASRRVTSMTDTQLEHFITSHPQGGFTLSAW
jgi:peptidase C39-like protein